jgi:hypothetical protein
MTKDGQQTPTANLKMGGFKFTALGSGLALTDSANLQQIQAGAYAWLSGVAGGTTITANLAVPTLATQAAGLVVRFVAAGTNTGASTLNINSLGATPLRKRMSGGVVELAAADLVTNNVYTATYDGVQFVISEQRPYSQGTAVISAATVNLDAANGDYLQITGTTAITAITLQQGEQRTLEFAGALTFTNSASLILPGGTNISTLVGDTAVVRGEAAGVVRCIAYNRAAGAPFSRDAIAGFTYSTPGGNTTVTIGPGQAADSTNSLLMTVGTAYTKTLAAWTVGTGNGGLDVTGSVPASTKCYLYIIQRPDTGVVDYCWSANNTTPNLTSGNIPSNYAFYRRIGWGYTDGSGNILQLTSQNGDCWYGTPITDFNGAGSTTAVLLTTSLPLGFKVRGYFMGINNNGGYVGYASDPANSDIAPNLVLGGTANYGGNAASISNFVCWTNTSAQIRHRESAAGNFSILTLGCFDPRGQNL